MSEFLMTKQEIDTIENAFPQIAVRATALTLLASVYFTKAAKSMGINKPFEEWTAEDIVAYMKQGMRQ